MRSSMTGVISVVVPTYNRAHFITGALESVKHQSYRPIELVVVDDGSTDNTVEVVRAWGAAVSQQPDFTLCLLEQENRGGNAARNAGIEAARGEYVAFLDSDDTWHPEKLQKQISALHQHENNVAVYCGLRHFNLDTEEAAEPVGRPYPTGDLLSRLLVSDVTAPTSTYFLTREVFNRAGRFDECLHARQDWDMWIRVAQQGLITAVPEPLVDYGEHSGSRTISDPTREIRAYRRIREKYAEALKAQGVGTRLAARSAYLRRMGRVHLHQGLGRWKALGYYVLAVLVWPLEFDGFAALAGWFLPKNFRSGISGIWNRLLGHTRLGIKSH